MKFLNSKKSILYIQLENEIKSNVILAGGRFGSFGFAKCRLVRWGKTKCAKCAMARISNFLRGGKKLKHEALVCRVGKKSGRWSVISHTRLMTRCQVDGCRVCLYASI